MLAAKFSTAKFNMNKLHNLFDMVTKAKIMNDLQPEDLFLAGLIYGNLAHTEAKLDKILAEIIKI